MSGFLDGFAKGAKVRRDEAESQWAAFSRQLSDAEIARIEKRGYDAGLVEGRRFAKQYRNDDQYGDNVHPSGLTVPTIHLNGSSPQTLVEDLLNARQEIREAMNALMRTAPDGRDYYPQGPDALKSATAEWRSRFDRLRSVYEELEILIEAIQEAAGI